MATDDFVEVELLPDEENDESKVSGDEVVENSTADTDTRQTEQADDDDDEQHDDDATAVESESDDDGDRQAIRERRRQERQERKLRAKEREDNLRRELQARDAQLAEMRQRLDVIDRRNSGSELAQLAAAKDEAKRVYNHFKDQIRIGTETNNGALVADATEKMMIARNRHNELTGIENALKQRSTQPQPLDQRVADNAKDWISRNKWYDPNGRDVDSRVVLTIDQALADEGFNPASRDYWDELSNRVKKYLPHRVKRDNMTHTVRSVVTGSGRETPASKPGNTFRLSAERVQALKDLGVWDDPKERDKMIKQYRAYDKSNSK